MTYEERKEVAIPKVTPTGTWPLLSVFTPCPRLTEPHSAPHLCQALRSSLKTFCLLPLGLKSSFHIPFTLPFQLAADALSSGGLHWAMYWAGPLFSAPQTSNMFWTIALPLLHYCVMLALLAQQ